MQLIHLKNVPILEQLRLEEMLLRCDTRNFCLFNEGSPPAIVMGISGEMAQLVNPEKQAQEPLPVIRRFSGGGTVVVDEETLFVSFICQKTFALYPERLLAFGEALYKEAWGIFDFHLKENDYAIGARKCAGNAQYIQKERWLQHTTFLWDYAQEKMDYLLHPPKTPRYREDRGHSDFLCRLRDFLPDKKSFFDGIKAALKKRFDLVEITAEELYPLIEKPHRKSTVVIG